LFFLRSVLCFVLVVQLTLWRTPVTAEESEPSLDRVTARRIGPEEIREFARELGFSRRQNRLNEALEKLKRVYPLEIYSEWENILRSPFKEAAQDSRPIFINFGVDKMIVQLRSQAMVIHFGAWPDRAVVKFNELSVGLAEVLHLPLLFHLLSREVRSGSASMFTRFLFDEAQASSKSSRRQGVDPFLIIVGLLAGAFVLRPYFSGGKSTRATAATERNTQPSRDPATQIRVASHDSTRACVPFPLPAGNTQVCNVSRAIFDYELTYQDTRRIFCSGVLPNTTPQALTDQVVSQYQASRIRRTGGRPINPTEAQENLLKCMALVVERQRQGCNPLQTVAAVIYQQGEGIALRRCSNGAAPVTMSHPVKFGEALQTLLDTSGPLDPCAILEGTVCSQGSTALVAAGARQPEQATTSATR
jgi:hypothetical protein